MVHTEARAFVENILNVLRLLGRKVLIVRDLRADVIGNFNRRIFKVRKILVFTLVFVNKAVVFIKADAVRVGNDVNPAAVGRRMVTYVH